MGNDKTDRSLMREYYRETDPLCRMNIARQVKDGKLRQRLLDEANVMRHNEDSDPW